MARVTVEDCVDKIPNRFDLVLIAAQRAKNISIGAPITVDRDNDKNAVVSLREIADETIDFEALRQNLITNLQKVREVKNPNVEDQELVEAMQELSIGDDEYKFVSETESDIAMTNAFEVTEEGEE